MGSRPTITDLAKTAGVSVATVDRVLNRRFPVREDTAIRVVQAAEAIGYHATDLLKRRLAETPQRRFGLVRSIGQVSQCAFSQFSGVAFFRECGLHIAL